MENEMEQAVSAILADCEAGRGIDRVDPGTLPDRAAVRALTDRLLAIVYPGSGQNLSGRIYEGMALLTEQLLRVLPPQVEREETARQRCLSLFRAIPAVRALAEADVQAAYDGDPAATGTDEILMCYPGVFAVTVYRLAHELYCAGVPLLPRSMTEYAHSRTGIDIHPGASIGGHFFIDHGTGVVIGETTVIGDRVRIYQGVTLGGLTTRGGQSLRGQKRHPTIGDDVTIYAGASVLGGETVIGRSCVIGSNVFITHSIPPCTTVSIKNRQLHFIPHACAGCPNAAEPFWTDAGPDVPPHHS